LKLYVGTGSVCESSNTWNPTTARGAEHLALTIRIAKALGSPVARCYLGNQKDRHTDGGIQKHIEETIKAIKANASPKPKAKASRSPSKITRATCSRMN
jgi:hypothetical protein